MQFIFRICSKQPKWKQRANNEVTHYNKPTDLDAGVVGVRLSARWVGEQNVLGFEVPMDYSFGLQDFHGPCNLLQENPNSVLTQCAFGCRDQMENKNCLLT